MPYIPVATVQASAGGGLYSGYAYYREQQTAGTDGGTFTSAAFRTRTLNTEVFDFGNIGTLASNQVTLQAGTYYMEGYGPCASTGTAMGRVVLKIVNVTDTADVAVGPPIYVGSVTASFDTGTVSVCRGRVTIATAKAFELQQRCETTVNTIGFGRAANFGVNEVYGELVIWKET